MKVLPARRHLKTLFLCIVLAAPVSAQTIYLDMDGDGIKTAADVLNSSGATSCSVILRTDVNADGSPAVCATGCQALNMNSYEFILRATGGAVSWGSYTGQPPLGAAFTASNATDFYARVLTPSSFPPGAYTLGILQVTVVSGSPTLDFETETTLSGVYLTAFGSSCYGQDYDNTYKLGTDWGHPSVVWHMTGKVFSDDNASGYCNPDPGEPGLSNVLLTLDPGGQTVLTDANGNYDLCGVAPAGFYTVTATPPAGYEQSCPWFLQPWTVYLAPTYVVTGINFAMKPPLAAISGYVFSDVNASGGCTPDAGESGLAGRSVSISPPAPLGAYAGTDATGYYRFFDLPSGTYTLTYQPTANWPQSCPSPGTSRTVFVGVQGTISDFDFAAVSNASSYDLSVRLEGGTARAAQDKIYGLRVGNDGQTVSGVSLAVTIPPPTPFVSSTPAGTYDVPSHTVTIPLGTLTAGQEVWPKVRVHVPSTLASSTLLQASATVSPTAADLRPIDNATSEAEYVRASYDPNGKLVMPSGRISKTQTLAYHVDFQNVGNAPALAVVVRDTLDPNLDPATVVSGGASHPYGFIQSGRYLTWTFNNIDLPDSTSDEPGSHGFLGYQARPLADVPEGTEIRNTASIYFDQNPPVVTSATSNIIDSAPVLASIPDRTAVEGSAKDQPLSASDAQLDTLTFTKESGPAWATVTTTGTFTGNLHLAPQIGDAGSATIVVRVSDGLLSDLDTCVVNVLTPTGVAETEFFRPQSVRLATMSATLCLTIAPASGAFSPADVDPRSVVLSATGTDARARAIGGSAGTACFRTEDLRALLSADASGRSPALVQCEGRLGSGGAFSGTLPLNVVLPRGALAASITPNPLHAGGVLTFRTVRAGFLRAALFDVHGRRVRTLLSSPRVAPGYRAIPIDGKDDQARPLASGVYFYRVESAEGAQTGRFTVLR